MKWLTALLLCSSLLMAQQVMPVLGTTWNGSSGVTPITVDATCSGTGSGLTIGCSSPMTVTAGDTIVCSGSGQNFDPVGLYFNDTTNNQFYDNVETIVHPGSANSQVTTATFANSASGSVTPRINNFESITLNLKCRALKGTPTAKVMDGGSVNQTKSSGSSANPTSGTAAAPTNDNEFVYGAMVRPSTATVSDASPWVPGGTITAVGSSYPIYDHYQIQTTATAANSPMTAAAATYIDTQLAVLNASNPTGYRPLTGAYFPAIAKTNGASTTVADLNGATTTLHTMTTDGGWVLSGTAAAYDTTIAPSGTGTLMLQGIPHAFGDAATSITLGTTLTATEYMWFEKAFTPGTPRWYSYFFRAGSSGLSDGQYCDVAALLGGETDQGMTVQADWSTGASQLSFFLEPYESGSSALLTGFAPDTDYWMQIHAAGVNERYNQLLVYSKSGSTWSLAGTLNYDLLCVAGSASNARCDTPPTAATPTGTASIHSTSMTLSSGTGTANGQTIVDPTNNCLPWPTLIESGGGTTSITLSQQTTCAVSGTTVNTYLAQPYLSAATNGSASSGSTALTVVTPGVGTIVVGNRVGGAGIANGTLVSAVAGTSVTLSQPTTAALSSGGVSFWEEAPTEGEVVFGKYSSCSMANKITMSGFTYDPLGTWGAFAPN